jgi:hypothetical protein
MTGIVPDVRQSIASAKIILDDVVAERERGHPETNPGCMRDCLDKVDPSTA